MQETSLPAQFQECIAMLQMSLHNFQRFPDVGEMENHVSKIQDLIQVCDELRGLFPQIARLTPKDSYAVRFAIQNLPVDLIQFVLEICLLKQEYQKCLQFACFTRRCGNQQIACVHNGQILLRHLIEVQRLL